MSIPEYPAPQLFAELAEKHGHYCPMSTLGLRLGWAARRRLKGGLQSATYFAQTCARDGIRMALGTDSLLVEDRGRHLLCFSDRDCHWGIELLPEILDLAATYRALASDAERATLLEKLRSADESALLSIVPGGGAL